MIVFKSYLRILKSYITIIALYTIIFIAIAIASTFANGNTYSTYTTADVKIAVINNDKDSKFINNFQKYVEDRAKLVTIDNDEEAIKDALFFRKVDYIMIVPNNYTSDFMTGKDVKIETMQVPDSVNATYSKTLMNKYLNTAKLYLVAGIDEDTLAKKVQEDISKEAKVTFDKVVTSNQLQNAEFFYNFSNYNLLSVIIMVVAMVMVTFNEQKIKRRMIISPMPYKRMNRQLLLGNVLTSYGVLALYVMASIALYSGAMFTINGVLLIANAFIFVNVALVLSYFLSQLTSSREIISGAGNVIGLGSSFMAGAFVPQQMLGSFVLTIAKFTPSYWFISNNIKITKLTEFNVDTLQPIIINGVVMIGFAIGFYILIQLVSKLKLKK